MIKDFQKENLIREGERLDDLERDGLMIIQDPNKFCFGIDAVLLSDFAKIKEGENVLDIGTGTGILPILLSAKSKGKHFTGLEIQHCMADMATRSVEYNGLEDRISIVEGDIKKAPEYFSQDSFDVITCNPPYMNDNHGLQNEKECHRLSRHEVACSLEDILSQSSRMLRSGGRLYLIHRPYRLEDVMYTLRLNKLEPKRLKFVHPYINKDANMVMIEATKGGKSFMVVEKPIIMYGDEKTID